MDRLGIKTVALVVAASSYLERFPDRYPHSNNASNGQFVNEPRYYYDGSTVGQMVQGGISQELEHGNITSANQSKIFHGAIDPNLEQGNLPPARQREGFHGETDPHLSQNNFPPADPRQGIHGEIDPDLEQEAFSLPNQTATISPNSSFSACSERHRSGHNYAGNQGDVQQGYGRYAGSQGGVSAKFGQHAPNPMYGYEPGNHGYQQSRPSCNQAYSRQFPLHVNNGVGTAAMGVEQKNTHKYGDIKPKNAKKSQPKVPDACIRCKNGKKKCDINNGPDNPCGACVSSDSPCMEEIRNSNRVVERGYLSRIEAELEKAKAQMALLEASEAIRLGQDNSHNNFQDYTGQIEMQHPIPQSQQPKQANNWLDNSRFASPYPDIQNTMMWE